MIKNLSIITVAIVFFALSGCAMVASPTSGALYTSVKYAGTATSNAGARKQGVSCASSILGIIATGDATIDTAKATAGISKVASVDMDAFSVLGLYARIFTIVKGE